MFASAAVCAAATLGFLPSWFVLDDLFARDRIVVSGRIVDEGMERVSAGRRTSDRLLLTVEGQAHSGPRSSKDRPTMSLMLPPVMGVSRGLRFAIVKTLSGAGSPALSLLFPTLLGISVFFAVVVVGPEEGRAAG